nr:MAG TPA: hypothetical protein [Caudoviricetes sp.]DAM24778.1 MAG TPA: hypothetical protein [Caudoviricetes sp.]
MLQKRSSVHNQYNIEQVSRIGHGPILHLLKGIKYTNNRRTGGSACMSWKR